MHLLKHPEHFTKHTRLWSDHLRKGYIAVTAPPTKPGDSFLLFDTLPYDFREDLPLPVGLNVYLDDTPQNVLRSANPPSLAHYVLPGFGSPGRRLTNCCLRSPACDDRPAQLTPTDLFFLSVTALRLRAPIGVAIAGQFDLGRDDCLIENPTLFHLMSPWHPDGNACYSGEDVRFAAQLAERQMQIAERKYTRLLSAVVLFSQVTCGHSKSFQMTYLALFSALEALFVPKGDRARTLARRVANFLAHLRFPGSLHDWLKKEYEDGRNKLSHGVQDVTPWTRIGESQSRAFGRLHEVTRLCILGSMSLDDQKLASISGSAGERLQKELDSLQPGRGRFLDGQRMWCD